jgi:hypothetical protein
MRRISNRKEVERLQKRGGEVTEKRWTGYRKEVDR